jgi:hypothetical protein
MKLFLLIYLFKLTLFKLIFYSNTQLVTIKIPHSIIYYLHNHMELEPQISILWTKELTYYKNNFNLNKNQTNY